jgi:hypothetical protein
LLAFRIESLKRLSQNGKKRHFKTAFFVLRFFEKSAPFAKETPDCHCRKRTQIRFITPYA